MTTSPAEAEVSLFRNSFHSVPVQTVKLVHVIEAIQNGHYRAQVSRLRQTLVRDGKRAYDREKSHLPAVTFCGTFFPSRGVSHLTQHSRLVLGDLDGISDVAAAKRAIASDPYTAFTFTSPSANGLKVGVHVPLVGDDAAYKWAWQTVATAYEIRYGWHWDPSGKDISRLCYVSFDPELYHNLNASVFDVPPIPSPKPQLPIPPRIVTQQARHGTHLDYAERAIRTAVLMIQSAAPGTRHHTRLRAARLLGGYVAGGLLSEDRAYGAIAQALVGYTEDLARALKTVEDGIAYGQAHPITVEALEAERQAWLKAHPLAHMYTPSHQLHDAPVDNDIWAGMRTLPLPPYRGLRLRKGR